MTLNLWNYNSIMGSVEVHILGQKYIIKGNENPDNIRKLADFVNEKLQEVYSISPNITPLKAVILTALNIADELQKLKNEYSAISTSIKAFEDKTEILLQLLDSN